jgi:thermitase
MKAFVLRAALALSVVLAVATFAGAASALSGKLGFGFEPGLEPGKDFVSGQLIVGLRPGISIAGIQKAAGASGGRIAKEIKGEALLLQYPSETEALSSVYSLAKRYDVVFVERNGFMRVPPVPSLPFGKQGAAAASQEIKPLSVSTDTGTGYQWHHTVIRKTATDLGTLSTTPPTVAVLDTGVDYTHLDLAGKVIKGKNFVDNNDDPFDDNGHGTHVAGIIAAKAGNNQYGEGVCPNCKILAVKVLNLYGYGSFFDVAQGMNYARTTVTTPGVKVISMSLGGPVSSLISTEVLAIKNAGLVLAAAAGNDNTTSTANAFPGADANAALRVMATEENDCRTWFSNFSPAASATQYNIAAPGFDIHSTLPDSGFGPLSGTSMATPVVAGAAALVWGQFPADTRDQLVTRLLNNAKTVSCGFAASTKRVDVRKAITGTAETALIGRLIDPINGKAPAYTDSANLYSGTTLVATDAANRSGSYEMTGLSAGTRILKANKTGYVNNAVRQNIAVTSGVVSGPFTDAHPKARTGDATITMDWKTTQPVIEDETAECGASCLGWDFDLIVKTPAAEYIYWENPGSLTQMPYVMHARDSFNDLEPLETIVIGSAADDGVYAVFAYNAAFTDIFGLQYLNPSWTGSGASVQTFKSASAFGVFYSAPPAGCGTNYYWYMGDITKSGTTYTWTPNNTCSNVSP